MATCFQIAQLPVQSPAWFFDNCCMSCRFASLHFIILAINMASPFSPDLLAQRVACLVPHPNEQVLLICCHGGKGWYSGELEAVFRLRQVQMMSSTSIITIGQ